MSVREYAGEFFPQNCRFFLSIAIQVWRKIPGFTGILSNTASYFHYFRFIILSIYYDCNAYLKRKVRCNICRREYVGAGFGATALQSFLPISPSIWNTFFLLRFLMYIFFIVSIYFVLEEILNSKCSFFFATFIFYFLTVSVWKRFSISVCMMNF